MSDTLSPESKGTKMICFPCGKTKYDKIIDNRLKAKKKTINSTPFKSLLSAKNDIVLIKALLINRFQFKDAYISILTDQRATHNGIRDLFWKLALIVKFGDMVYTHYSKYGSSACDLNGDEKNGREKDSTWTPYSARVSIGKELSARICAISCKDRKRRYPPFQILI